MMSEDRWAGGALDWKFFTSPVVLRPGALGSDRKKEITDWREWNEFPGRGELRLRDAQWAGGGAQLRWLLVEVIWMFPSDVFVSSVTEGHTNCLCCVFVLSIRDVFKYRVSMQILCMNVAFEKVTEQNEFTRLWCRNLWSLVPHHRLMENRRFSS